MGRGLPQQGITQDTSRKAVHNGKGVAMDRIEPKNEDRLSVGRAFHRSRLVHQWSASAYEILVPEVRRPMSARGRVGCSEIDTRPTAAMGA